MQSNDIKRHHHLDRTAESQATEQNERDDDFKRNARVLDANALHKQPFNHATVELRSRTVQITHDHRKNVHPLVVTDQHDS